jgi:hypothetical protein
VPSVFAGLIFSFKRSTVLVPTLDWILQLVFLSGADFVSRASPSILSAQTLSLPLKFSAPQLQQAIFLGLSSQEFAPVTALVLVSVLVFLQLGRAWFSTESRCGSVFSARS